MVSFKVLVFLTETDSFIPCGFLAAADSFSYNVRLALYGLFFGAGFIIYNGSFHHSGFLIARGSFLNNGVLFGLD